MKKSFVSRIRKVKGNKIELEIAQFKATSGNASALVGLLNASDDRFSRAPRRAWISGEFEDMMKNFPHLSKELDQVNGLEIGEFIGRDDENKDANLGDAILSDKTELSVQILEGTSPLNEYQAENAGTGIKKNPKSGEVITHGGKPVYSLSEVVIGDAIDKTLESDKQGVTPVVTETPKSFESAEVS